MRGVDGRMRKCWVESGGEKDAKGRKRIDEEGEGRTLPSPLPSPPLPPSPSPPPLFTTSSLPHPLNVSPHIQSRYPPPRILHIQPSSVTRPPRPFSLNPFRTWNRQGGFVWGGEGMVGRGLGGWKGEGRLGRWGEGEKGKVRGLASALLKVDGIAVSLILSLFPLSHSCRVSNRTFHPEIPFIIRPLPLSRYFSIRTKQGGGPFGF